MVMCMGDLRDGSSFITGAVMTGGVGATTGIVMIAGVVGFGGRDLDGGRDFGGRGLGVAGGRLTGTFCLVGSGLWLGLVLRSAMLGGITFGLSLLRDAASLFLRGAEARAFLLCLRAGDLDLLRDLEDDDREDDLDEE